MNPILLISGTPGCGKSTVGAWFARHRGFTHVDLEHDGLDIHGFRGVWEQFFQGHDIALLSEALLAHPAPIFLDWGYPPILWPRIAELAKVGIQPWWFEGDRLSARARFIARATVPVWSFDNQCAAIAAAWNELAPLYGNRIVHTLFRDGCFAAAEEVAAAVLGAV